ncbi:hypothetical protein [Halorussus halophilus]|uniref:hypothetical protein n=1 Tax=Halorussus halophilus TaxID=2650975 RepID=UPI0013018607|nr:hypothetical protein [Halorussus halophilus]
MRRTRIDLLLLALCVLLSGCASSGVGTSPRETTTDGCPPTKHFSKKSLPEKPAELTNETAVEFAVAYENATTWNEERKNAETELNVNAQGSLVNRTKTGYVVHVSGGISTYSCHDGQVAVGDGFVRANYFVNDSTVVKLEHPENRTTDPRDGGVVVERWNTTTETT